MGDKEIITIFKDIQNNIKHADNGAYIHVSDFKKFYMPLINYYITDKERKNIDLYIIGIQGPQGVGKTVFATLAKAFLKAAGYRVETISVDDFYKSNDERLKISKKHIKTLFIKFQEECQVLTTTNYYLKRLKKLRPLKIFVFQDLTSHSYLVGAT